MSEPFYIVKPTELKCSFATETGKSRLEEDNCVSLVGLGKEIYERNGQRCSISSDVYLASPKSLTTLSLTCESELNLFSQLWTRLPDSRTMNYKSVLPILLQPLQAPIVGLRILFDTAKPDLPKPPSKGKAIEW